MKKEQNEREDIKIVEDKKVIKIKDKKKKNQNNIINENDNENNNNNIEQNEENDIDKNIHFCEVLFNLTDRCLHYSVASFRRCKVTKKRGKSQMK